MRPRRTYSIARRGHPRTEACRGTWTCLRCTGRILKRMIDAPSLRTHSDKSWEHRGPRGKLDSVWSCPANQVLVRKAVLHASCLEPMDIHRIGQVPRRLGQPSSLNLSDFNKSTTYCLLY